MAEYTRTETPFTYVCRTCGALIRATDTHTQWHDALDAGARTVSELVVRTVPLSPVARYMAGMDPEHG